MDMCATLAQKRSSPTIYLTRQIDLVIPLPFMNAPIEAINARIPEWAASLNSTESPIVIADCYQGFTNSMLRDGIHPNLQGDELIASRVGPLLLDYVKQSLGQ